MWSWRIKGSFFLITGLPESVVLCTPKNPTLFFAVEQMASVKFVSLITLKLPLWSLSEQNGSVYYGEMSDMTD